MGDQRLGTMLWRGKWLVLVATALGVGLAVLVTKTTANVYQATALLNVSPALSAPGQLRSDQLAGTQALAATYATLIVDRSFLAQVASELSRIDGVARSPGALGADISAKAVANTTLVQLNADQPSPRAARDLANRVASAFVANVRRTSQQENIGLQSAIQGQIKSLNTQIAAARAARSQDEVSALQSAQRALTQQQAQLLSTGLLNGYSVSRAGSATASASPIRPRPVLNIVAGVMLGLLLGFGLAYLRARLDRGLHGSEEVEALLGVPILAHIPIRSRYSSDDPVLGEAFDVLRANLTFVSLDASIRVLTLSSFNPREGKTSTVQGLAHAAVRGGMSVVMVDGDVRTRSLSERTGYVDAPGLTSVVIGAQVLDDALISIAPGLSLLPAGPTPPNPASLLSSERMRDLVLDLREKFSLVVIDSPPVAHLADASILASVSDAVVLIARVGVTARADLPAAAATIRHSPTPLLGAVVLESRTIDQSYYPAVSRGTQVPEQITS